MPSVRERVVEAQKTRLKFVHYTSAEVAVQIIRNKEVWMRRTSMMNDFSEVEFGLRQLSGCFLSEELGGRFRTSLERISPGVVEAFLETWRNWENEFVLRSYITSLSEHLDEEDKIGRLSMWRAYGGNKGVALVVNAEAIVAEASEIESFTIPVKYVAHGGFPEEFEKICSSIEKIEAQIKNSDQGEIIGCLCHAFASIAVSTKHIGFHEEREWRLVAIPSYFGSNNLRSSVETVDGIPQPVFKIPIGEAIGFDVKPLGLEGILDKIIIGPTNHGYTIADALITELNEAGISNPQDKVVISDIPLR